MRVVHGMFLAMLAFGAVSCSDDEPQEPVAPEAPKGEEAKPAEPPPPEAAPAPEPAPAPQAEAPKPEPAPAANTLYVTTSGLNVRSGPGMNSPVVKVLRFNAEVVDQGRTRVWVKIGEGQYVSSKYLSPSKASSPNDPAGVSAQPAAPAVEEVK